MISRMRIAAVLGAVVLLASACDNGGNPLAPSARPALNGGGHTAGGNVVTPPGSSTTYGTSSADAGAAAPSDTTLVDGGGHTAGGN